METRGSLNCQKAWRAKHQKQAGREPLSIQPPRKNESLHAPTAAGTPSSCHETTSLGVLQGQKVRSLVNDSLGSSAQAYTLTSTAA